MATTDFIAAIELSSSKISGIAGKKSSDGSIQVLAYAREDASPFIHKGAIYNIDKAAQALTSIINKLEGQLNNSIAKVYVGIGGQSLRTVRNAVSRTLEEESIISQELVDEICDENRDVPLVDMSVLDVAPQEYKIDNTLHVEPVGVAGRYITGQFLNIVARASLKKNLEHSFEQAKVEIADDLLVAPTALAKAVLTENEMRSGCALVDFGADTTTVLVKTGAKLPMFTSCCPAWVKYLENENPKYLKNISTCKSPMEMVGAIFRDKYAAKDAADGRTTYHIAIMPCTAKKMEAARPEFIHDGRPDVDLVLTTHEVIDMMQETGIQLGELELESPDLPFGLGSGAAVIYGTSGGVAEAVVRHCLPDKSKNALREISILGLRGDAPIKEASVTIGDTELKLAVVNGLANAKKLLKEIDEGKKFYHLIEVMTCQGGCVGGAGQPYGLKKSKEKRGDGLHLSDNAAMFKRAERNPVVAQMMAEYGEERCHELLHVTYTNK